MKVATGRKNVTTNHSMLYYLSCVFCSTHTTIANMVELRLTSIPAKLTKSYAQCINEHSKDKDHERVVKKKYPTFYDL